MDESKVGKFDQLVRALCVVLLVVTLCGAFLWGAYRDKAIVSTDAFVGILSAAITWLFKSRDEKQRQEAQTSVTKTTETDPSGAKREVTTTTPPGAAALPADPPKGVSL